LILAVRRGINFFTFVNWNYISTAIHSVDRTTHRPFVWIIVFCRKCDAGLRFTLDGCPRA
jgi:hypothetical protein